MATTSPGGRRNDPKQSLEILKGCDILNGLIDMEGSYLNLKKIKDKDGEIAFEAELAAGAIAKSEKEVLREAGEDLSVPGFRKGKVPPAMVRERMDPVELLEEVAHKALPEAIHGILESEYLSVLGRPEVAIVKLAPGNPVVFTVRFALVPEIGLPNYKSIARKISEEKKPIEVSPEEIEDAVKHIREMFRGGGAGKEGDAALPELTDDFAKQFGPYKNIAEFKEELGRNLKEGKERDEKEKRREAIVQAIVAKTKIKIPKLLVDQELAAFFDNRDAELKKAGISLGDYLKQVKKTEEELEKEEREAIEKQIAASLIMGAMRKEEKIAADEKDITANIAALKRRYPDRTDAELWEPAEAIAMQKKLFDVLEGGTD
jgi:FKBP-type peptidyl-prolyl cis-trans isomerase (trigger factor)